MSQILPRKSEKEIEVSDPQIIDLGSDEAEIVLDSLSSKTTREVFMSVYDDPSTKSEIAEEVDNSIQNTKYHIDKLEEADLIESKRTDYSEKGNEMDVYGPTHEAVILLASDEETRSKIRDSMKPLVLTIGFGAVVSSILARFVSLTGSNTESLSTPEPEAQRSINEDSAGIQSTESDSSGDMIQDSGMTETNEIVQEIAIGFIDLSPSVAIALTMITGIVLGSIIYFVTRELIS